MSEEVSNFKVPYTKITEILPHPNAEKLEYAKVFDFTVIVQKDKFKVGDSVFYVPIDSILSPEIESVIFPVGSKIKLHKSRIKQIKIRGYYSSGMLIDPKDVTDFVKAPYQDGDDYSVQLGISKYEPPAPSYQSSMSGPRLRNKPFENPYFRKFNGLSNIKWEPYAFKDEEVVVSEKIHGSHVRLGRAPFVANTFWKKVKKFFGFAPKYECVYGSNNVELTNRNDYKGFYNEDVYGKCIEKLKLFDKVRDGEFVHGELIGPGVQKGYDYGHKEHHIVIFDVRVMEEDGTQRWLNPEESEAYAKERGFDFVPVLHRGPFNKEVLEQCTVGKSVYCPKEIREGCVVRSRYNYSVDQSKRALKSINPEYLETDPSDNH